MNKHVITFNQLGLGEHFRTSRLVANGGNGWMWCEYEKISQSQAICTKQIGYGNTRQVNSLHNFGPNAVIFRLPEVENV